MRPVRLPCQTACRRIGPRPPWLVGARLLVLVLALALAIPVPSLARAEAFERALHTWLHDDEGEALGQLSDLAQGGDLRARLLLGLIDKTPALQGPWLSQQTRDRRMTLLRAPGGLSGRSWLTEATELPLAAAWLDLLHVGAGLELAERMAAMGEARAARQAVGMLAAREELTAGEHWPHWMDPELAWLVWPVAGVELRSRIEAMIPHDHPQRAMMGLPIDSDGLDSWLQHAPAAAPLRAVCLAHCPASLATCLRAAHGALGSHAAVLTLGSPVEGLIPQEIFLASRRGRSAVLRRILLATDRRGQSRMIETARAADACLGETLAQDAARYRFRRPDPVRPSAP